MLRIIRRGIAIDRQRFKGIYMCVIGTMKVACTLREGKDDGNAEDDEEDDDPSAKYGPITLLHQGQRVTLRLWDPYKCVVAAGLRKKLVHFPIRPRSRVFALDCSLHTLSHTADIVGPNGRLIGVFSETCEHRPSQPELKRFLKRHPTVSVVFEDVQNASLDRYQRLLSIPYSSKIAFLMALHPRLGADSPAHKLSTLQTRDSRRITRKIFEFLESWDAADVKCLVNCYWPPGTRVDVIREVLLNHIGILQRWRSPKPVAPTSESSTMLPQDSGAGETGRTSIAEEDGPEPRELSFKPRGGTEQDLVQEWIFLDLPTDNIVTNHPAADSHNKLAKVREEMHRYASGLRTGLSAKEQLSLSPYFPKRALLLLKYVPHRNERSRKVSKSSPRPREDSPKEALDSDGGEDGHAPPPPSAVPSPAFGFMPPIGPPQGGIPPAAVIEGSARWPMAGMPMAGMGWGHPGFSAPRMPGPGPPYQQQHPQLGGAMMVPPGSYVDANQAGPCYIGYPRGDQTGFPMGMGPGMGHGFGPPGMGPPGMGPPGMGPPGMGPPGMGPGMGPGLGPGPMQ